MKWGGDVKKILLITRYHMCKWKTQTITITLLMIVAAMMFHLWLMLSMDYKQNFERSHDAMHAEDVTLLASTNQPSFLKFMEQTMQEDARTKEYAFDNVLYAQSSFSYQGGEVAVGGTFLIDKETAMNRTIGKVEIVEEGTQTSGIYLPMLYRGEGGYEIGDTFHLHVNDQILSFPVVGFTNSLMSGSHNCVMVMMMLSKDRYNELKDKEIFTNSTLIAARIHDKQDSEDYETMLKSALAAEFPNVFSHSNHYYLIYNSRYISQMICAAIVSAMALFVMLIALIVIFSNIINHIQEDMRNLGALKAIGYQSSQIIHALLFQYTTMTAISVLLGILASYGLFPTVNAMMIAQTGIPYEMHFLLLPMIITLTFLCGIVYLVVWYSARRIKHIDPIIALRQGVKTHSFQHNRFPLTKSKGSLSSILAYKTICTNKKQNVILTVTTMIITLIIVFCAVMFRNFIADMDPFVELIVGESADSCVSIRQAKEDAFLKFLSDHPHIEHFYLYSSENVGHVGGAELYSTMSDDFTMLHNQRLVCKGRFPKYDNEVAVGAKYADENHLIIGDVISLSAQGKQEEYLITGLTQTSNNLGKDALLTRSGYERLGKLNAISYYINVKEGIDIDAFHDEVKERFGSDILLVVNVRNTIDASASVYISIMTLIVFVLFALSLIIVTIVLYLLVKTMLNHKKHEYGILKAIGFTSFQLMIQTIKSFLPVIMISTLIGILCSAWLINPLLSIFLKNIGIVHCMFIIPADFLAIAGIAMILYTLLLILLLSLRIRKIAPITLLNKE